MGWAGSLHTQERWELGWTGLACTEGHLPASSTMSPAGLLLPSLTEMELLGSESCTQRALLQQGQPARAVCKKGINLELAKGWQGIRVEGSWCSVEHGWLCVCSRAHKWQQV